jgi:hypothetical protein
MARWVLGLLFVLVVGAVMAAPYNDIPYETATYYGDTGGSSGGNTLLALVVLAGYALWFAYVSGGAPLGPFLIAGAGLAWVLFEVDTVLGDSLGGAVVVAMVVAWWAHSTRRKKV